MDADHIRLRRDDGAKVLVWRGLRSDDVVARETIASTEFTEGMGSDPFSLKRDLTPAGMEHTNKTAAPKGGGP